MTTTKYQAIGPVRGACGHAHRSIKAAVRCAMRDTRECRRAGAGCYSDRVVRRLSGEPLTPAERDAVIDAYAEVAS